MAAHVVTTEKLSKRYGATEALCGLDLSVPKGSVFGLLGPNGAGKSTTFGILCGWLRASAGAARVLDLPTDRLHALRGRVAALPQDARFPPHVAIGAQLIHFARLMGLSRGEAVRTVEAALEAVDLRDAARLRGSQLSHGMLKRAGIAQVLLGSPEVIFLDEPTAGLDPKNAHRLKLLIASLAPRATVVISSHNLAEVQQICTHGAILDRGRLVVAGSLDVLTRRGAEIAIEVVPGAQVPEAALHQRFGADAVSVVRGGAEADVIRIRFSSETAPADAIGAALTVLLREQTPILGITRGTSLERAFLDATSN